MANDKLMLEAVALIADLRAENAELRKQLGITKAAPSDNTVRGAIASTIQKDLARRQASQVTKTAGGDTHPHFLNDAVATRKARQRADADREIRKHAAPLLDAVQRKAGLR